MLYTQQTLPGTYTNFLVYAYCPHDLDSEEICYTYQRIISADE
jgi:hypothetical protein